MKNPHAEPVSLVSLCCEIAAILGGTADSPRWHECSQCGRPCDPTEPAAVPYDDRNGEHSNGPGVPTYHHFGDSDE